MEALSQSANLTQDGRSLIRSCSSSLLSWEIRRTLVWNLARCKRRREEVKSRTFKPMSAVWTFGEPSAFLKRKTTSFKAIEGTLASSLSTIGQDQKFK